MDITSIITCVAIKGSGSSKEQSDRLQNGILLETNYRLCSLDKAETLMGDTVQLVKLKDPMASSTFDGKINYNGDWSTVSSSWERVSPQERDRLLGQLDSGEFWMSFVSLTQTFASLECIHLDTDTAKDELSLADRPKRWAMKMYQGNWMRGVSAGGCRNHG